VAAHFPGFPTCNHYCEIVLRIRGPEIEIKLIIDIIIIGFITLPNTAATSPTWYCA
jgi:hypothetical protein